MKTFLLAFGTLFSIVNPLSGAFIFFGATRGLEPRERGPGTISVAVSLGASRQSAFRAPLFEFFGETLAAVALMSLLIYMSYRNSGRLADLIGPTGTTIVVRLSAFLLFCIGSRCSGTARPNCSVRYRSVLAAPAEARRPQFLRARAR